MPKQNKFAQSEYLRHELLDRTGNVQVMFDTLIAEPFDMNAAKYKFTEQELKLIRKQIAKTGKELVKLYQMVGVIHI